VKLNPKLPEGSNNGLTVIEQELVGQVRDGSNPKVYTALVLLEPGDAVLKTDGDVVPSVTLRAIEVIREDLPTLARILRRAKEQRTGNTVLPFDLGADLEAVYEGIDLVTGEVYERPADGDDDA
jgi:hypothetical protein